MPANLFRGDYDQLAQIAQRFAREHDAAQRMLADVQRQTGVLQSGDWVGQGAQAFYAEMNSAVLPSLKRLAQALQSAQRVTAQISREIKQAEDEAAAVLKDTTGEITAKPSAAGNASNGNGGGGWLSQVGGFFEGVWEGGKGMVQGVAQLVTHPIDTVKGLAYGITHPAALWEALKKPYVEDWQSGNKGRAIGRGAFEVIMLLVPGLGEAGGAAKGAEVAGTAGKLSKMAELGDAARLVAKGGEVGEATRMLRIGELFSDTGEMSRIIARAPELETTIQKLTQGESAAMKVWDGLSDAQKFETAEAFHAARRGLELPDAAKAVERFTGDVNPSTFPGILDRFGGGLTGEAPAQVLGKEVTALGTRDATLAAAKNGERILNAAEGWTPEMNALWVKEAASRGEIIHVVSPVADEVGSLTSASARYDFTSVYARELDMLAQEGYTRVGDYLIPPAVPKSVPVGAITSGAAATGIAADRLKDQ